MSGKINITIKKDWWLYSSVVFFAEALWQLFSRQDIVSFIVSVLIGIALLTRSRLVFWIVFVINIIIIIAVLLRFFGTLSGANTSGSTVLPAVLILSVAKTIALIMLLLQITKPKTSTN